MTKASAGMKLSERRHHPLNLCRNIWSLWAAPRWRARREQQAPHAPDWVQTQLHL